MGPPQKSKPLAFKDALVLEHLVSFVFRNGRSLRLRHRPGGSGHAGHKRNKVRHGPWKALGSWSGWNPESVHKEVWFASCNRYLSAIWVGQGGRHPVWWERALVAPLQARRKLCKHFFHSRRLWLYLLQKIVRFLHFVTFLLTYWPIIRPHSHPLWLVSWLVFSVLFFWVVDSCLARLIFTHLLWILISKEKRFATRE